MDNVLVKFLPFECRLTLIARRRLSPLTSFQQWMKGEDASDRNLLVLDFEMLTYLLKNYFDNYLEEAFRDSLYAPFRDVVLTGIDRRMLAGVSNEVDAFVENTFSIEPIRTSSLRKRRGAVFNVSKKFDGVAVFTRDGDMPIPSSNVLQSKQLQAHADESNELLYLLRGSPPESGLNNVAAISLNVDVNNYDDDIIRQQPTSGNDYDLIIIVAVIVAGCSMVLLAFALYLAFRRRNYAGARPMVEAYKLSPRTETELSPTSNRQSSPPPPVKVMEVYPEHDDNISDYTESVYSLPAQTKQQRIKESLAQVSNRKHQRISSRFNPRYVISSKKSNDGGSERSSEDDENSFGIPHLASSEKTKESERNKDIEITSNKTETEADCLPAERSGLYPADIIDDDITSSLSAYGKGIDTKKQHKLANNDDGVSLSSYESYGFSLDGVGDQSTMANSTRYGY